MGNYSSNSNSYSYVALCIFKPGSFVQGFASWFSLYPDRVGWVRPFLPQFELSYGMCSFGLNLLRLLYPHFTLLACPFSFGSVKSSLLRCQDRVLRKSSVLAMCLNPFLFNPSGCVTRGVVHKVAPSKCGKLMLGSKAPYQRPCSNT